MSLLVWSVNRCAPSPLQDLRLARRRASFVLRLQDKIWEKKMKKKKQPDFCLPGALHVKIEGGRRGGGGGGGEGTKE